MKHAKNFIANTTQNSEKIVNIVPNILLLDNYSVQAYKRAHIIFIVEFGADNITYFIEWLTTRKDSFNNYVMLPNKFGPNPSGATENMVLQETILC